jgi:hypothetical protein
VWLALLHSAICFQETSLIPSSPVGGDPVQRALACADNQRHHHLTQPAARASPLPRPTAERHPCPGLAAGGPEASAAAPFLHPYGSAIGEVSIFHLVIGLIQVLICDVLISSSPAWIGS